MTITDKKLELKDTLASFKFDKSFQSALLHGLEKMSEEETIASLDKLKVTNEMMPKLLKQAFELNLLSPKDEFFSILCKSDSNALSILKILLDNKNNIEQKKLINEFSKHAISKSDDIQKKFANVVFRYLEINHRELDLPKFYLIFDLRYQDELKQRTSWPKPREVFIVPNDKYNKNVMNNLNTTMLNTFVRTKIEDVKSSKWLELLMNINLINLIPISTDNTKLEQKIMLDARNMQKRIERSFLQSSSGKIKDNCISRKNINLYVSSCESELSNKPKSNHRFNYRIFKQNGKMPFAIIQRRKVTKLDTILKKA